MKRAVLVAPLLVLAGCTVGPDYSPPAVSVPAGYAHAAPAPGRTGSADLARWWHVYRDPELDRLVATALTDSPDIRTAQSKLRQARFGIVAARAQLLPQLNASGGDSYTRFSKNAGFSSLAKLFGGGSGGGGSNGSGVALPGGDINTYQLGFDASWELDVFGGSRRAVQSAVARAEASQWQLRDAQVSLAAEVANDYLSLRTLQAREAVARQQLETRRRAVQLAQNTARAGLAPQSDAIRQRGDIAETEAALPPLMAQQAIQIHALAVLVGRQPEDLLGELQAAAPLPATPPPVPPGLPSDLLRRRPDVRAAERSLAAATADIGVAVADLYPRFNLTGAAQLISTALSNLFTPDSAQITASAQAMFPILDWGKRHAEVKIRREQREQAYLNYQRTVLGALRDVEDALVRIQTERRRNAVLRAGVTDDRRALAAAEARQQAGLADLSAVLQAREALSKAEDSVASSDGQLLQDSAALYKALGGGWQSGDTAPSNG